MAGWILGAVAAAWFVVYLGPDLWFHHLQWGAFQGSPAVPRVALTFDDGPGPDTLGIAETLEQYGVRATFFVVAEEALKRPAVVKRLAEAGHEIGLHMSRHVSSYTLAPWQSYRLIGHGLRTLEQLTGQRPVYFRPPWGHVNLGTWWAVRRYGLVPVFWSIAPDDWRSDRTAEAICRYVVQLAQPGAVIVLHDAGGSRERTRLALPAMIQGLRALGLEPGRVSELATDRSFFRRVWTWWEIRFTRSRDIQSIPNRAGGEPFLRIGIARYHGPRVTLNDGTTIQPGDRFGEIHFGNPALSRFSERPGGSLKALHQVVTALSDLADWLSDHEEFRDIRAVGGITLLDAAHTIEKLGFQRVRVRGWLKWSMWIYLIVLLAVYHSDGWKNVKRFRRLEPVLILMSRDAFVRRYQGRKQPSHTRTP
ncbi:MAG: polysaccharide deacetylase family protein [Firmicutes bacterium]|nr:polysaccharide deacetylase family protein [Bacillota bacterium]